jgi:hypothetical protein
MIKLPAFKLAKIITILKWGKIAAKVVALGTTISGAITALTSSSVTTGFVLGATGATTYVAVKTLPNKGYEKTTHISPKVNNGMNRNVKLYNPSQVSSSPYNAASNHLTGKR